LFFSNSFISNWVLCNWEQLPIRIQEIETPYDIGIVLSGVSNSRLKQPNVYEFFNFAGISANRLTQSIELYKLGKIKKILLSGGWSNISGKKVSESEKTKLFLVRLGIPEKDILVEPASRNTYENALYSKMLLEEMGGYEKQHLLLLTSASHMFRAKKCFNKVGLNVTSFSVDFHGYKRRISMNALIPSAHAIGIWQVMIKEWVGIIAYKLRGYI